MKISKKKIIFAGLAVLLVAVVIFVQKRPQYDKFLGNKVIENLNSFEEETEFEFAIFGDTHYKKSRAKNFKKAVSFVKDKDVDLIFTIGDNVSSCDGEDCKKRIREWGKIFGSLTSKLFCSIGNHDVDTDKKETYGYWQDYVNFPQNGPEGFEELTYSLDYGNAHFVVLVTNKPKDHKINDEQLKWLESDLKNNQKEHTFVFFHESAFPIKDKIDESLDVDEEQRDKLWSILDKNKVTAVFSGHEHLHSRRLIDKQVFSGAENGVYQFVVGNTNYFDHDEPKNKKKVEGLEFFHQEEVVLIVGVKNDKVVVKTYSVDGELVEEFQLR